MSPHRLSTRRRMLQQACLDDDDSMNHDDEFAPEKTLWKTILQPWGWIKFSMGPSRSERGFVPASLAQYDIANIQKHGVEGTHYAVGFKGLAIMMRRHGVEYKAKPNSAMINANNQSVKEMEVEGVDNVSSLSCCTYWC